MSYHAVDGGRSDYGPASGDLDHLFTCREAAAMRVFNCLNREEGDKMKDVTKYKCPECGKNHLEVLREQGYEKTTIERYPCVCDNKYPVAFERALVDYEEIVSHAWLEDDGNFEFHETYVNQEDRAAQPWDVDCRDCWGSDEHDVEPEYEEECYEELPDWEKWTVRCARCIKEFDFAWTEPERDGKIVVEGFDDFDPDEVLPESAMVARAADDAEGSQ